MEKIKDIYLDEIRDGFLVTSDRKKIWNIELEILLKFDFVCKKHNLTYFLDFGTLLGAIRHGGFIPWDDDIDVTMPRPEYMHMKKIAAEGAFDPYFFQDIYSDSFVFTFSKIRDSKTSAIEFPNDSMMNQGIFIDIFPLDIAPDGTSRVDKMFGIMKELWCCVIDPKQIDQAVRKQWKTILNPETLKKLTAMPYLERMKEFELFCLHHFNESSCIGEFTYIMSDTSRSCQKKWYEGSSKINFESFEFPIPMGYDKILKRDYGNYHEFVRGGSFHEGIVFSADIPYNEYIQQMKTTSSNNI